MTVSRRMTYLFAGIIGSEWLRVVDWGELIVMKEAWGSGVEVEAYGVENCC